jgi:hypothetical protein
MLNSGDDAGHLAYFGQLNTSVMKYLFSIITAAVTSMILTNLYTSACQGFSGYHCYVDMGLSSMGLAFSISSFLCLSFPIIFMYSIAERSGYTVNISTLNQQFHRMLMFGALMNIKSIIFILADLIYRLYVRNYVLASAMSGPVIVFTVACGFIIYYWIRARNVHNYV